MTPLLEQPYFPPLLRGHAVLDPAGAGAAAHDAVRSGSAGAGDLFWLDDVETMEVALVLEPEVSARKARQMGPLAMVALADGLGTLLPPKVAIQFRWPHNVLLNGGDAGTVTLSIADHDADGRALDALASAPAPSPANGARVPAPADGVPAPAWLIITTRLALSFGADAPEPGERGHVTCLSEEGGEALNRTQVIEAYAAHLLNAITHWQDDGFRALHDRWLFRAVNASAPSELRASSGDVVEGLAKGLDDEANLLLASDDGQVKLLRYEDFV
ncbi:MAG: biotin/lipoate--protein ligase family protein [Pseudomonadota bacterium]